MSVEAVVSTQDFNVSNPAAGDVLTEGDNHLRALKVGTKVQCWEHVGTASFAAASSASTYALIGTFESGYDYHLAVENLYLSSAAQPFIRVSTGGGTADSGSNYTYNTYTSNGATGDGSAATTRVALPIVFGDASGEAGHFEVTILNPMGTTNPRHLMLTATASPTGVSLDHAMGGGMYITTTAVDGIVIGATPTITGTLKLYRRHRPT
jgi:hypothetical protein